MVRPPEMTLVRSTVPAKLLKLVSVILDVPSDPDVMVSEFGFEERPKSGPATTLTVDIWIMDPLTPVTLIM